MPEPRRATDPDQQSPGPPRTDTAPTLLLVTGPGRSGTSAVTGALSQLGIHVPPPLVGSNESNERGFYETRWVVDFQKEVLAGANTYEFDADPRAVQRITRAVDEETRGRLIEWLGEAVDGHQQVVIKDPRSVWLTDTWVEAAEKHGLRIGYLTMLRYPTEVVGSRSTYYGNIDDDRKARDYAISKVAGWINVSLLTERQTRGRQRVYLRYTDLLEDWRTALGRVRDGIGLQFNTGLAPGEPNPVDDFITPTLHRIRTGWDELDVPEQLQELADDVWTACERLANEGGDADLDAEFDALTDRYSRLYRDAAAITSDTRSWAVNRVRSEAADKTKRLNRRLARTQRALAAAERELAAAEPAQQPRPAQLVRRVSRTTVGRARRLVRRMVRGVRTRINR